MEVWFRSFPCALDAARRVSRTYSRSRGPHEPSLAAAPGGQLLENWYRILAER
jgi:hypothetical protein